MLFIKRQLSQVPHVCVTALVCNVSRRVRAHDCRAVCTSLYEFIQWRGTGIGSEGPSRTALFRNAACGAVALARPRAATGRERARWAPCTSGPRSGPAQGPGESSGVALLRPAAASRAACAAQKPQQIAESHVIYEIKSLTVSTPRVTTQNRTTVDRRYRFTAAHVLWHERARNVEVD